MRRTILLLSAAAIVVALAPHASAGGSWLDVVPSRSIGAGVSPSGPAWAGVGATVSMHGRFNSGVGAPVTRGNRYFAYLSSGEGSGPPVLLGEAVVRHASGSPPYLVSITFDVPDVRGGQYLVQVCTAGCTNSVGDLVGGALVIAPTPTEARLRATIAGLRSEVREGRSDSGQPSGSTTPLARLLDLKIEIAALRSELEAFEEDVARTESQRDVANRNRAAAIGQIAAARDEAASWRVATYVVLIVAATAVALALVRRRRYVRVRIPDSPRELLEAPPRSTRRERS